MIKTLRTRTSCVLFFLYFNHMVRWNLEIQAIKAAYATNLGRLYLNALKGNFFLFGISADRVCSKAARRSSSF